MKLFERKIKTVPQLARKSAALIRKRGWAQGVFESSTGKVCALGAIRLACSDSTWEPKLDSDCAALVNGVVDRIRKATDRYVVGWNDDPHRTEEEVLAMLDLIGAS